MTYPAPATPLTLDHLSPLATVGLYLLLASVTIALWHRSPTGQTPGRRWTTLGIRLAVLGVLVLVLAGARFSRPLNDVEVVVLRDVSASADQAQSLPAATLDAAVDSFLSDATRPDAKPANDRVGVIRFNRDATVDSLPSSIYRPASGAIVEATRRDDTDVASAVRLALSTLAGDAMHRIVLLWDGRATRGDLDAAAAQAAARHVPIDVMPLEYRGDRDLSIDRVDAPPRKREGEPFSLRVVVRSTHAAPARARLAVRDRGRPLDLDPAAPGPQTSRPVTLSPGLTVLTVDVPDPHTGVHDFEAALEADADTDAQPANNAARAFTVVTGRTRILYVDNAPDGAGNALADVLTAGHAAFDVTRIAPRDFPDALAELQGYDGVVLANVPHGGGGGLDESHQRNLATYVHDLGGGLLVIGGAEAFGAGGWIGSDLEKILPVDCSIPSHRVPPAGLLVVVLDRSGSMSGGVAGSPRSKQDLANEAAILALRTLAPQDLVGVVAFDTTAEWVVPVGVNARPENTARAIRAIGQGGGTSIPRGLELACAAVESVGPDRAAVKHILVLTDGKSDDGDYDGLLARLTRAGASLSTVGVGADVNPELLAHLAKLGTGRYHPVTDASTLPQVFIKEARTVRRTLIREGVFTPALAPTDSPLVAPWGAAIPPLRGMVLTTPKPNPSVRVPLVSPDGDPVLAHWQAGLGRVVAFTSDAGGAWGAAWASSDAYARFWTDAVRWASRPPANTDFQVLTSRTPDGARAKVVVLADEKDGSPKNFLAFVGQVVGPDLAGRDLRLAQTGPGRYEGAFDLGPAGNYVGLLRYRSPAGETGTLPAGFTLEASAELRETSSDNAAMLRVVNATGGRMLQPWDAPAARLFSREGLTPETLSRPVWDALIAILIGLFLVDVAARRLAWGRDELARAALATGAWIRSHTTVRRADPTASLDALRSVRTRVAEANDAVRATVTRTKARRPHPTRAPEPAAPADDPGASGLLAAKRRALRRFEEDAQQDDDIK